MIRNTTKKTDAVSSIQFVGNVIPPNWYKTIRKSASEKGKIQSKPHLLAINILADIIYWYRNTVIRDEISSEVIEIKRDLKAIYYNVPTHQSLICLGAAIKMQGRLLYSWNH